MSVSSVCMASGHFHTLGSLVLSHSTVDYLPKPFCLRSTVGFAEWLWVIFFFTAISLKPEMVQLNFLRCHNKGQLFLLGLQG